MVAVPIPAVPTFTDGLLVHQGDLNSLPQNLLNLYSYNLGGFRTTNPACAVRVTAAQSIPNAVETQISWDVADVNNDNMWSAGNPNALQVNTGGVYMIALSLGVGVLANHSVRILVNGTNSPTDGQVTFSAMAIRGIASAFVALAAGSVINATLNQATGSTQNLDTSSGSCRMSAFRVSI